MQQQLRKRILFSTVAILFVMFLLVEGCSQYLLPLVTDQYKPIPAKIPEDQQPTVQQIRQQAGKLEELFTPFEETVWSKHNPTELKQSLAEYIASDPNRPTKQHTTLYVQPLGEFNATQQKILNATIDLLGRQFTVPVKTLPAISLDTIPAEARRESPHSEDEQILSTYVLNKVLKPRRPDDAVALLCLTTTDLWPGHDWNFVFGQATLKERVGVWSMARYGDPQQDEAAYQSALLRTLKVAIHETGHMFGIQHCLWYRCGMNGSMSLPETDEAPLAFCPECSAKLWWATGAKPETWYNNLAKIAEQQQLKAEAEFWNKCATQVNKHDPE